MRRERIVKPMEGRIWIEVEAQCDAASITSSRLLAPAGVVTMREIPLTNQANRRVPACAGGRTPDTRPVERVVRRHSWVIAEPLLNHVVRPRQQ